LSKYKVKPDYKEDLELSENIKNLRNLDSAIKCKTIFSWGEDNSGCE